MFDVQSIYQATSVEDAIRALCADEKAMIVSGGTDVWVQNRDGRHAGLPFVSVHGLKEISGVSLLADGTLSIGAATCFTDVTENELIQRYVPMLGEAADQVGSPQIRNAGTIGGNVCNGVTSADTAPSLFALDAVLLLRGKGGERRVPIATFYAGPGKTVRDRGEVLCRILIPQESYAGVYGQYIKYGKRNAMEISTLGCAVTVRLDQSKQTIERLRIAYGVAAPTPMRCLEAEEACTGRPVTGETVRQAADAAVAAIHPRTSWRASKDFRLHLARELCVRAMEQAILKAGGTLK